MSPLQYLAACKTKLGHCTDYALAKKWDIEKRYMGQLVKGQRPINARVAFLIAITLELDPATVLADIESQQQQGKAGEFWRSFLSRAQATVAALLCTLALALSATTATEAAAIGGNPKRRIGCFA